MVINTEKHYVTTIKLNQEYQCGLCRDIIPAGDRFYVAVPKEAEIGELYADHKNNVQIRVAGGGSETFCTESCLEEALDLPADWEKAEISVKDMLDILH